MDLGPPVDADVALDGVALGVDGATVGGVVVGMAGVTDVGVADMTVGVALVADMTVGVALVADMTVGVAVVGGVVETVLGNARVRHDMATLFPM